MQVTRTTTTTRTTRITILHSATLLASLSSLSVAMILLLVCATLFLILLQVWLSNNRGSSNGTIRTKKDDNDDASLPQQQREQQQEQQQQQLKEQQRERARRFQHATTGFVFVGLTYFIPPSTASIATLAVATLVLWGIHRWRLSNASVQRWFLKHFGALLRPEEIDGGGGNNKKTTQPPGALYFLASILFLHALFEPHIARHAILCLSVGDPMAAWIGRSVADIKMKTTKNIYKDNDDDKKMKKNLTFPEIMLQWLQVRWHGRASVAGSLACFTSCILIGCCCFWITTLKTTTTMPEQLSLAIQQQQQQEKNNTSLVLSFAMIFMSSLACTLAEAMSMQMDNLTMPLATAITIHFMQK